MSNKLTVLTNLDYDALEKKIDNKASDIQTSVESILTDAKAYTDEKDVAMKAAIDDADAANLEAAKAYAEELVNTELQSNYDLWLSLGYEGEPEDFIQFLRGDSGDIGKSAYETWLEIEGNEGKTEQDFFNSLKVSSSNYDFWLSLGYVGTPQDYLDSLKGKSAYEVWEEQDGNNGKTEEDFIDSLSVSEQELTKTLNAAKKYTDDTVAALVSAESVVSTHNVATDAHNDIRDLIIGLTTRLDAVANSDDETLDQMKEVVAYIKANRSLIDSITTGKISTSDIVDNLTTNNSAKVLSASQGVALKGLIDSLTTVVNGKVSPDQLGDQVTFSLDGTVLTITSK